AQIRYMAVEEKYQGRDLGSRILRELERKLFEKGADEIILKAREKTVSFYENNDYEIYKDGEILFGEIKHYWMRKR
ncbi:MAG: GNAT family N-acetyltransferase, partial [Candidatus Cloacimonadota bacterium]|nr:GNAT family N-acetyltransferase [Candidatus Cloacimonadota bacterium]